MKPNNHIKIPKKRIGVLMVNLGTPEKTDFINMWKYLREFLSDRRIIELTELSGTQFCMELFLFSDRKNQVNYMIQFGIKKKINHH